MVPSFIDFFEYGFINKVFNYNNLSGTWKDMAINRALLSFIESYRKYSREACRKSKRFTPDCRIEDTARNAEKFISIGNQCGEGWLLTGEMVDLIDSGVKNILCLHTEFPVHKVLRVGVKTNVPNRKGKNQSIHG